MSDYLHISHGKPEQHDEVMDLLDTSFGFKTEDVQFLGLLPKLYKKEYNPAGSNVVLDVDGKLKAGVGLYYNELDVCGEKLKVGGIGNVACLPEARNMGYMRFCMAVCLDEMKQNMTDMSYLGGARQRYERYSYEPAGIRYLFIVKKDNTARVLGKDYKPSLKCEKITADDKKALEAIFEIYNSRCFKAIRNIDEMYDILKSWHATPYAVKNGDEIKGWFCLSGDKKGVLEIGFYDEADIKDIVYLALYSADGDEIEINVPPFEKELCAYLGDNCEYYSVNHPDQYTIFSYENVIRAFLKLKATYAPLTDGELVLLIEGEKLPEQIKITVKNNDVTVTETDEKPDITLTHLEAMRLIGSLCSKERAALKPECAAWFPLPLYTYPIDGV